MCQNVKKLGLVIRMDTRENPVDECLAQVQLQGTGHDAIRAEGI